MSVVIGSTAGYLCLDSWVMAKILQLGVWDFCCKFLSHETDPKGRQFDQTTQAARSVAANIAEGSARRQTSVETELKLLDVARASLSELIDDLTFVCLRHGCAVWNTDNPNALQIKAIRLDRADYSKAILHDTTAHILAQKAKFDPWLLSDDMLVRANALILLSTRVIAMLRRQMQQEMETFKAQGGFTERMTAERLNTIRVNNENQGAPACPTCGATMLLRTARKGVKSGSQFWSCSNFHSTGCRGTLPYPSQ